MYWINISRPFWTLGFIPHILQKSISTTLLLYSYTLFDPLSLLLKSTQRLNKPALQAKTSYTYLLPVILPLFQSPLHRRGIFKSPQDVSGKEAFHEATENTKDIEEKAPTLGLRRWKWEGEGPLLFYCYDCCCYFFIIIKICSIVLVICCWWWRCCRFYALLSGRLCYGLRVCSMFQWLLGVFFSRKARTLGGRSDLVSREWRMVWKRSMHQTRFKQKNHKARASTARPP